MVTSMASRRNFLTGIIASSTFPRLSWADAGNPKFLAASKLPNGKYILCGINASGKDVFRIPLPGRGHAASAHPTSPEAVAFARRPGRFALVINCMNGSIIKKLTPPNNIHFYGHGCYVDEGRILITSENRIDTGEGLLGLWDSQSGYKRIGEVSSGGIGPHEIKQLPNGKGIMVANGGIRTHPDHGRKKLNLDTMRSNISHITSNFSLDNIFELPKDLYQNSIRHLDISDSGEVAFGTQWQGDPSDTVPLVGLIDLNRKIGLIKLSLAQQLELKGYVGSIAISRNSQAISVTSPRGGVAHIYEDQVLTQKIWRPDICGTVSNSNSFVLTCGSGLFINLQLNGQNIKIKSNKSWDNHIIAL